LSAHTWLNCERGKKGQPANWLLRVPSKIIHGSATSSVANISVLYIIIIRNFAVNTQLDLSRIHINYTQASTLGPTSSRHHEIGSCSSATISPGNVIIFENAGTHYYIYGIWHSQSRHYSSSFYISHSLSLSIFFTPLFYRINNISKHVLSYVIFIITRITISVRTVQFADVYYNIVIIIYSHTWVLNLNRCDVITSFLPTVVSCTRHIV